MWTMWLHGLAPGCFPDEFSGGSRRNIGIAAPPGRGLPPGRDIAGASVGMDTAAPYPFGEGHA